VDETWETRHIGRLLRRFDTVASTNTLALELANDPALHGLVVLAREQTAGRGRQGRRWICPKDCGVLMSVLLFPPERLRQPALLTALAAVAVCETIHHHARVQATIKWPNDVLIRGKKVSGILVEQGRGTVIGIGLNVNTPSVAFAEAGLTQASSLAAMAGAALELDGVARTLIETLDSGYAELGSGLFGDLESRWRGHMGLLGKRATVRTSSTLHTGQIVELAFSGVVLQGDQGTVQQFRPELIQQITPAGGWEQ
jgi:BirA family biotin operon repressor/biotin-[acetyl-CoA-carboxylase] ligase